MMRVVFVLLLLTSATFAQPKPGAKVPTRAVPCANNDLHLFASGPDVVVCWATGCMELDMSDTSAKPVAKPPATKPWMIPAAVVRDKQVCLGSKCKPLGKKLMQAIATAKKDADPSSPVTVEATSDLGAVVFGTDAWSVAGDRKLGFVPPASYAKTKETPTTIGLDVAGALIIVSWSACAGPCTRFSITDSSGRAKGPTGAGGGGAFQLDAKRFVVMSEYADVRVFDLGTAKSRGSISLFGEPQQTEALRLDDETIIVKYERTGGIHVVKVSLPTAFSPFVSGSTFLPSCTR